MFFYCIVITLFFDALIQNIFLCLKIFPAFQTTFSHRLVLFISRTILLFDAPTHNIFYLKLRARLFLDILTQNNFYVLKFTRQFFWRSHTECMFFCLQIYHNFVTRSHRILIFIFGFFWGLILNILICRAIFKFF